MAPCPTPGWAELVHPELEPAEALARLWEEIAHICRLDDPDPVAAWQQRMSDLTAAAEKLDRLALSALRFEGPGTELTVGLFPTSRWMSARLTTVDGIAHTPNLPTEEVFTTPGPRACRRRGHRHQAVVRLGLDDHRAAGPLRGRPGG